MLRRVFKAIVAVLISLTLTASRPQTQSQQKDPPQPYTVPEAYQVYSAILAGRIREAKLSRILIAQETRAEPNCLKPDSEDKQAIDPAIADYTDQNRKTWLLRWNLQIDIPYEIVPREAIDSLLRGPGGSWGLFERRYPEMDGWIDLSAVGFNSDKTVAVVSITHDRSESGSGNLSAFKLEDGQWVAFGSFGCGYAWAS